MAESFEMLLFNIINLISTPKEGKKFQAASTRPKRPQSPLQALADGLNRDAPDDLIDVFLARAREANYDNQRELDDRHISAEMLRAIARDSKQ